MINLNIQAKCTICGRILDAWVVPNTIYPIVISVDECENCAVKRYEDGYEDGKRWQKEMAKKGDSAT